MFLFLLGFLQVLTASDSTLIQQSKSQADYYINQIEEGHNLEENLWSLTTLATNNKKEVKKHVEQRVKNKENPHKFLIPFKEVESSYELQLEEIVFQKGSSNLLIALLLAIENEKKRRTLYNRFYSNFDPPEIPEIDYASLCESIIEEKELTGDILTNNKLFLPHFFLLYYDNTILSDDYLQELSSNTSINKSRSNSITDFLKNASLLRIYYLLDEYSKIDTLYNALITSNPFPNTSLKLNLYRYLDYSMYRLGNYDRSLGIVRKYTLPLSSYLDQKNMHIQIKQLQGVYLYNIGKVKAARQVYEEVLNEVRKKDINIPRSSFYNNLALAYYKSGQYDEYLDLQFQALETAQEENNYNHQIEILNNLFIYYRKSNDEQNALSYLEKAQQLAEKENNSSDLGTIYMLRGSFFREFKSNFEEAHKSFSKAEQILNTKDNTKKYLELLNERAETFEVQQKFNQALNELDEIIDLTPEKNNPNHIEALVNKALLNLKANNINNAAKFIQKFKPHDLNQLDFEQIVKAKTVEADYLQRTGKAQEALDILEPALDQVVARAKSSADLKSGFWHVEDEYLDAFNLAVSIYQQLGQPEQAIQKLDQFKTINDASLYQNPLVKSSLLNESELTQYKQLTDQLDATRKKLLTAPEDRQLEIQQTISQLKLKKRKLDQKLTRQIDSESISVREIQNRLSARELVLHITELNDQFYIGRISRSDISINTIPLDSTLSTLLSNSAQRIATNETNLDSLYEISEILDLRDIPDRIEQITLIPDSYFYQLPLDILPMEKPSNSYSFGEATYLIEKFRTQYLTSLADFKSNSKQPQLQNKLSYTGYGVSNFEGYNNESLVSLPYAQTEVTNIASKLTNLSNIQTFVNEQSTKSTFKKTAPESQIIHLATHSEVSERDPMFSTVYLSNTNSHSPDSTFDSQIFAYELFELDLSNEMIMLNSCESGSGSYIQGTGVMGMSRALQYAGANSLVLNLWSVNDMLASDFAIHFYDELNKGKSKAEALQKTKQYFLKNKNASPHFWGPYMLIGNSDPVVQPNQDENMIMAGTFLFYFLLMVGLSYLSQQNLIFGNSRNKKAA